MSAVKEKVTLFNRVSRFSIAFLNHRDLNYQSIRWLNHATLFSLEEGQL
jgi:hypothetical protein